MRTNPAVALLVILLSAPPAVIANDNPTPNPPAPGFDLEGSDAKAIEIADDVMAALGGRAAWDSTRHLRWRFFGRRLHVWDKQTGDVRIETVDAETNEPIVILMNLASKRGKAFRNGRPVTDPDELDALLDRGEALWINDGYWMFMPYKLKDTGVTLRFIGGGELFDGRPADVLELTFEAVGRTPENKYRIYVARDTHLVERWDYYADASDPEPSISTPWYEWRQFGGIMLSADRGDNDLSEIAVFESLPDSVYTDPAPVDWSAIEEEPRAGS
jgi:hypothetical protein